MNHNPARLNTVLQKMGSVGQRKREHLKICIEKNVSFKKTNGFEHYEFEHRALPELGIDDIDTSTTFLGKALRLPFLIEAMTGGCPGTGRINRNLARAAETLGIAMGVGSQRAMLNHPELIQTYQVRRVAPSILLFGNIGATQLTGLSPDAVHALIRQIEADGLVVHLNAAQELCQPEGDKDWRNIVIQIKRLCKILDAPVIVKETGCGIAGKIARLLAPAGIKALDVAGAGGTAFTRVEYYRGAPLAKAFFEWGIPTAESLKQCKDAVDIPLIASGGIRTGLDCAKAIAMGASLAGFALPLLQPALTSHQAVIDKIKFIEEEFRMAMLLVGAANIQQLAATPIVI
ncbi:type 2 isopentenyl-diphosphate Delta-isomerase [Desulfosarcina variabilis]|uniref:type 2 isopentenyl-diphosphate Delta-isomerase n=1 Tax=Desulfosarcina variabilis TaxID=2300 RepID=UPI003AFB6F41